jgi:glycosyltransferase involved in cell wall biosynthesis
MKHLSVIVPMYNVEPYVERCIRSLEEQDIPREDYEIICINDGSPDDCRGVVKRLMIEFDNLILIDQENQGVSRARNNGIDKAVGRYIMFIDPDDYVEINSFGRILKKAYEFRIQVFFLGFTKLDENNAVIFRSFDNYKSNHLYSGIDTYRLTRGDGRTDPDRMWAVLFNTEFINNNNLRYLPDVPYLEDGEFIARILCLAERCAFEVSPFYLRTKRQGSATNSKLFHAEKATKGFLLAAGNLKKFQLEKNLSGEQKLFLNQPIVKFVMTALSSSIGGGMSNKLRSTMRQLKN